MFKNALFLKGWALEKICAMWSEEEKWVLTLYLLSHLVFESQLLQDSFISFTYELPTINPNRVLSNVFCKQVSMLTFPSVSLHENVNRMSFGNGKTSADCLSCSGGVPACLCYY